MLIEKKPFRQIRSYCRREGRNLRKSSFRQDLFEKLWPLYGSSLEDIPLLFKSNISPLESSSLESSPKILEIGFGDGQVLLQMAKENPETLLIGVEVYRTGIIRLLKQIQAEDITNIRVICADAVDVLALVPENSLDKVQIFFPDPWPKARHHKRRLIQPPFVDIVTQKLKTNGILHLATDWEDYATQMLSVCSACDRLKNLAGENQFSARPDYRPVTKYEERGIKLGHPSWDLLFWGQG